MGKCDKGREVSRTEMGVGFRIIVSEKTNPRHIDMLMEKMKKAEKEKQHENEVS